MPATLAPAVRSQFAKRLRSLRAQRGYERARHFARSLGIEENRYTRYERAEVEPNLTLFYEMCQKLQVTPNELLGFNDGASEPPAGFGEPPASEFKSHGVSGGSHAGDLRALAWQLAAEATQSRSSTTNKHKATTDPLGLMRETARLYSRLEQDPFGTIAEIVDDPVLQNVGSDRRARLAELIRAYTDRVAA